MQGTKTDEIEVASEKESEMEPSRRTGEKKRRRDRGFPTYKGQRRKGGKDGRMEG